MDFTPYSFLSDLGLMSILLIIGQLMRSKFKIVQNLFLPASMVAGILGLLLGRHFLNILPFSEKLSSYPYMFIIVIFGAMLLGKKDMASPKKIMNDVGDSFTFNLGVEVLEFGVTLTLGSFLLDTFWPDAHVTFPLAMPGGFFGGHGYGTSLMGTVELISGWDEAITMAHTFATIGILVSVIVGVIFINIGVRKGYTRFTKKVSELPEEMRTGFLPEDKRESIGTTTTQNMSIDSVTWHMALVMITFVGGYYGTKFFLTLIPDITLPETSLAMLVGLILTFLFNKINYKGKPLARFMDRQTITKITGTFGDYLVAFGIASIDPNLVIKYIEPIVVLSIIGVVTVSVYIFVFAKRLFHNFWFERGMMIFGWGTGTAAMGMTLVKIIDPEYRSGTVEDYGMAYLIIAIFDVIWIMTIPALVIAGYGYITGFALLAFWAVLMLITKKKYGVQSKNGAELRPGELEIINKSNAVDQVTGD